MTHSRAAVAHRHDFAAARLSACANPLSHQSLARHDASILTAPCWHLLLLGSRAFSASGRRFSLRAALRKAQSPSCTFTSKLPHFLLRDLGSVGPGGSAEVTYTLSRRQDAFARISGAAHPHDPFPFLAISSDERLLFKNACSLLMTTSYRPPNRSCGANLGEDLGAGHAAGHSLEWGGGEPAPSTL